LRRDKGSNGEIDIMEVLGDRPDFLNVTLHYSVSGATRINRFVRQKTTDLTAGYHVYTLMWSDREIAIALDGIELARTATPDSLKEDMYLLMNLAVGGKWPGSPNQTTVFPAEFKIDYVRIWQENVGKRP
jgi:beta-glucanase (GH16 family)